MVFKTTTFIQKCERKSRRDDTLLTVGFNLRVWIRRGCTQSPQVPQGRYSRLSKVSSLQDFVETYRVASRIRRLKPTVNKVLSLRDISLLTQHFYNLFIFRY